MIHSARPTVLLVAITILNLNLFLFFEKWGRTDGHTEEKIVITTGRPRGSVQGTAVLVQIN